MRDQKTALLDEAEGAAFHLQEEDVWGVRRKDFFAKNGEYFREDFRVKIVEQLVASKFTWLREWSFHDRPKKKLKMDRNCA